MARRKARRRENNGGSNEASTKRSPRAAASDGEVAHAPVALSPPTGISGRKRWMFRLVAAIGIPCALFLLTEGALWLLGAGYPVGFYLRETQGNQAVLINNPQFGWRYFGRELSREACENSIVIKKPVDTVRIVVLGESAAYGDPQADFGLPRMLSAVLSLRHPGRKFEVINAAMTSINTHVIRRIAQDNVATNADIWVTYIGNNEVVGPFGAGTVFGQQAAPLSVVRTTYALKATRTGQTLDRLIKSMRNPTADAQWGGLMMFVNNHVRADEPRMEQVYSHFRANLGDIIDIGKQNGIRMVVSSVAVNLKDSSPFASSLRPDLSADRQAEWKSLYDAAIEMQKSGDNSGAIPLFEQASDIDDTHAELHFRWAQALSELQQVDEARRHFQLACDFDTLRFRCDSRLNAITRELAAGRENEQIRFVDAADAMNARAAEKIAGKELFYEHVHLTFPGNYQLARLIAQEIELLLPKTSSEVDIADWPTLDQCAKRLAWADWALSVALSDILIRLGDPPFSSQSSHDLQVQDVKQQLKLLRNATRPDAMQASIKLCRDAIRVAPDDHIIYSQMSKLLANTGDLNGALDASRRAADLLPHNAVKHFQMGLVLAKLQRDEEALLCFRKAFELNPQPAHILLEMAKTQFRLDRNDDGIKSLHLAIKINPRFASAYLTLGAVYEDQARLVEAEEMYRLAVRHSPEQTADLARLAQVCESRGWIDDAIALYRKAIGQASEDPGLRFNLAQCLYKIGKQAEAEKEFRNLVELAPNDAEPRFLWAVTLARTGKHTEAIEHFAAALKIQPDLHQARIGLGISFIALKQPAVALREFNDVLRRDPTNAIARQYASMLQSQLGR